MKKLLATITAIAFAAGCAGCAPTKENVFNPNAERTLKIQIFDGEYGTDWLDSMASAFTSVYTDVKIEYDKEVVMSQPLNDIIGTPDNQPADYDLVIMIGVPSEAGINGYIEDITDVLFTEIEGEGESPAEKMFIDSDYYNVRGKYYGMPWAVGITGFLMNATALEKALGDDWEVPVTTDEMYELCTRIKNSNSNVNSFIYSVGEADYWIYIRDCWWAQYQGADEFFEYYHGLYRNADGTPDPLNETEPKFAVNCEIANQDGREIAVKEISRFINTDTGFSHKYAGMDFTDAQLAFWGWGYGNDTSESVFMPNGNWVGTSMNRWNDRKPQDISMIKVPVVSSIKEVLPEKSVQDDGVLAEVIRAIDAGTGWDQRGAALESVAKADWDKIEEARKITMINGPSHYMCIPSAATNIEDAKKFMTFFASDAGCEIFSLATNGQLSPFNTGIFKETAQTNGILKSCSQIATDMIPVYTDYSSEIVFLGGLSTFKYSNMTSALARGTSPESVITAVKNATVSAWPTVLTTAGLDANGNPLQ